jgi:two-component system cell cycle sensor histidine kinase/response regulator CckA
MRKHSVLLISLFFLQLIASSPARSSDPVRVGVYQNTPLTFEENGKTKGYFIDILEHIASKKGWEIKYVHSSLPECLSNLENGNIDLLGAIAYSVTRGRVFDYTYESVITNWGQMYLSTKSDIESIIDLKGKKVAVLQNDIFFNNLRKLVDQFGISCRFIEAFEYEDVLELVEIGRCEAGLVSQIYGIQRERDYDIVKSSILINPQKQYWAAPKGKNQELLYTLDSYLRELKNNQQSIYHGALAKWFGIGVKSKFGIWFKWIMGGFVVLFVLFLTTSLILSTQVKSKTKELLNKNEELRESEQRFRNVYDTAPLAFVVWDINTRVTDWNKKAEALFEWTRDEVIGNNFFDFLIPEKDRPLVKDVVNILLKGELQSHSINDNLTKDGKIITCEWNNSLLHDNDGNIIGAISLGLDITERKQIEEEKDKLQTQLQQAQRMEAIGTLAGGVAHDLNNILSGIVSYPELLLMDLPEDSPLRKPILTMQDSGKRAAAIVQDLLTLARRGVVIKEVVNLNDIINEYLKSPEHEKLKLYYSEVEIETNIESDLLNISGSSVHLSKTIMNLVSNAAEAIPDGGKIFISAENRYIDRPISGYDRIEEGDYITLVISDTGIGILPQDMERIFEPFHTKKIMGRSGTGLGMTVVWGTVKDHKGYIDVQSTEGKGSTFTLYFPATKREIAKDKALLLTEEYMGKGEVILVIDDVKGQREIAFAMLAILGYSAHTVSSGEEAVEYLKDHSVDLIVLDMIMDPGIDGLDTYKQILELHPRQKAIIASGFSETDRLKETQRLGAGSYVKKPYTLEKIGLAVKAELGK